jgi:hypothetical protein
MSTDTCETLFEYAEQSEVKSVSRADQILAAFEKFHKKNPEIWELFKKFSLDMIARGRTNYSSNAIFERIRWHVDVDTNSEVKLSNNLRPYYARMFHIAHPEHDGFFKNKKLTSKDVAAHKNDIQVFTSQPAGNEDSITSRISEILNHTTL